MKRIVISLSLLIALFWGQSPDLAAQEAMPVEEDNFITATEAVTAVAEAEQEPAEQPAETDSDSAGGSLFKKLMTGSSEPEEVAVAAVPDDLSGNGTALPAPDAEGVISSVNHKGDIVDFLKILSVTCNKNIVPTQAVRGPVEVNLFNITWREALEVVLKSNGFVYEEEGPFIYVYTEKEYEEKQQAARRVVARIFHLNYLTTLDAEAMIRPLLSEAGTLTRTPDVVDTIEGSKENWAGSNALIVVDYPERLEAVARTLQDIDRRPPQVLVEATILVASLDDKNELGVDFNVLGGVDFQAVGGKFVPQDDTVGIDGLESSVDTDFTSTLSGGGLNIGIVSSNIGLFVKALESTTDVVTLGNPKVLTLNRQTGQVIVGKRDGYITTEISATTSTQTVEFLETGTQMVFTPFVMDDGYIRMELHPKDSDGGVGANGLPSENTTEVTSNVLVRDGRTIVIGGLFREKTTIGRSQIPVLGNIPLMGELFKSSSDNSTKEEVIFLITPHIVKEEKDYALAEEILERTNSLMLGAREGMHPTSRDRLASVHYNRAREAQTVGDIDSALWHTNLALYASPTFLDAIELKNELQGREMYEKHYGFMKDMMQRLIETSPEGMDDGVSWHQNHPLRFNESDEEDDDSEKGPREPAPPEFKTSGGLFSDGVRKPEEPTPPEYRAG